MIKSLNINETTVNHCNFHEKKVFRFDLGCSNVQQCSLGKMSIMKTRRQEKMLDSGMHGEKGASLIYLETE